LKLFIDVQGASGAMYRYSDAAGEAPSSGAGNFVYVRGGGPRPGIVFAGETDNLRGCRTGWERARLLHSADGLYVRLNVRAAARRAEQADIVAALDPPMNRA
jgi:hypothetical protein